MNNADKLLRWIVGIFVVVFVIVAVVLFLKVGRAQQDADHANARAAQLYDYLREQAPIVRARHHELCARVDTLAIATIHRTWGCDTAEVPKDPPPPEH